MTLRRELVELSDVVLVERQRETSPGQQWRGSPQALWGRALGTSQPPRKSLEQLLLEGHGTIRGERGSPLLAPYIAALAWVKTACGFLLGILCCWWFSSFLLFLLKSTLHLKEPKALILQIILVKRPSKTFGL